MSRVLLECTICNGARKIFSSFVALLVMLTVFVGFRGSISSAHDDEPTFFLRELEFSDSVYLPNNILEAISAPLINTEVSFSQLQSLIERINRYYNELGILTAQATLPAQDVVGGVVRIELLEAVVQLATIENLGRTSAEFVGREIPTFQGTQPDYDVLGNAVRRFQLAHGFEPQISFRAAEVPGGTEMVISGKPPTKIIGELGFDDYGSPASGIYRSTGSLRWNNLAGMLDYLSLQSSVSRGGISLSSRYEMPSFFPGSRMGVNANVGQSLVIDESFEDLDISSSSEGTGFDFRQYFGIGSVEHYELVVDGNVGSSRTSIGGVLLTESLIYDASVSLKGQRTATGYLVSAEVGVEVGNAQTSFSDEPKNYGPFIENYPGGVLPESQAIASDGTYWTLKSALGYTHALGRKWSLSNSLDLQYARTQDIPVSKFIAVGGPGSLRGYPQSVRATPNGLFTSSQISLTDAVKSLDDEAVPDLAVAPFAFVDAGLLVPKRTITQVKWSEDFLVSAGMGIQATIGGYLDLNIFAGVPLRDTDGFEDSGHPVAYGAIKLKF